MKPKQDLQLEPVKAILNGKLPLELNTLNTSVLKKCDIFVNTAFLALKNLNPNIADDIPAIEI